MKKKSLSFMTAVVLACALAVPAVLSGGSAVAAPSWHDTGGGLEAMAVFAVAYDAERELLYAATPHGVWRCADPYSSPMWRKVSTSANIGGLRVNDLAYDPTRNVLYAATATGTGPAEGTGVWMSTNPNGASGWSRISGAPNLADQNPVHLALDRTVRNKLYVASAASLWRCNTPNVNATRTWDGVAPGLVSDALAYDGVVNMLFFEIPGFGAAYSADPDGPFGIAALGGPGAAPALGVLSLGYDRGHDVLYVGAYDDVAGVGAGVYRCADPGGVNTWADMSDAGWTDTSINALEYDPTADVLYAGGRWAHGGANTGEVFTCATPDTAAAWQSTGLNSDPNPVLSMCWDPVHSVYAGLQADGVWRYGETISSIWYLAEGTTAWGFSTYISVVNPNVLPVSARVTYMTNTGAVDGGVVALPAESQVTIEPSEVVPNRDFSTKIQCVEGLSIAADRTMTWTGPGALAPEGHCSVGVTSPALNWYLPEGSSEWGFECWLLIQNPTSVEATCTVTYMIEGKGPREFEKKVPANSRRTYNMEEDIGTEDASIQVESDVPVIPERAMYRNDRREGHDSIGTTASALEYFLAEGTTAWGFTTYVLVQNPNDAAVDVTVTYMTNDGPVADPPFEMPANSRKTIRVNDDHPNLDLSTSVVGTLPIIAERAMYWDNGTGEACHDSIGMNEAHVSFFLPDGQTSGGYETWTLVQNPNGDEVAVEITYLTEGGTGNVTFNDTIGADSRSTYNMVDEIASGRAGVLVTCTTPDRSIMVERAMYWHSRGAGTDTIGGYTD